MHHPPPIRFRSSQDLRELQGPRGYSHAKQRNRGQQHDGFEGLNARLPRALCSTHAAPLTEKSHFCSERRRFEVPTAPAASSPRSFKSISGTRIICFPVPPCASEVRIGGCCEVSRTFRKRGTGAVAAAGSSQRLAALSHANCGFGARGSCHSQDDANGRFAQKKRQLPQGRKFP